MNMRKTILKKVITKSQEAKVSKLNQQILDILETHYYITGPQYLKYAKDLCAEIQKHSKKFGGFDKLPAMAKFQLIQMIIELVDDADDEMRAINDRIDYINNSCDQFPKLFRQAGIPIIANDDGSFGIDTKQLGDEFDLDISDIDMYIEDDEDEDYEDDGFEEGLMDLLTARVKAREEKAAARAAAKAAKAAQATDTKPKKTTQKKTTTKAKTTTKTKAKIK